MILGLALGVSALASWWLAQHLSAPIRRIQAGARALAGENLSIRVSAGLEDRKDEVAVLARDFDTMADQSAGEPRARSPRNCCATSLMSCARPLPACGWPSAWRASRPPMSPLQLDRLEREVERLDAMIGQVSEAGPPARQRCGAWSKRALRPR